VAQNFGACVFMPFLTFENQENVRMMHYELRNGLLSTRGFRKESTESTSNGTSSQRRDARLHEAYSQ
jgi:hypothetical protein